MVIFHIVFDLSYFSILPMNVASGFWRNFALLTAILFVSLVGTSLNISYNRSVSQKGQFSYIKYLKRGLGILALGFLITGITYFLIGEGFIIFGVLHCIGVSIIVAPLFFFRPRISLFVGLIALGGGYLVSGIQGSLWLAWIGIHPATFYTLDYFPLLPWFGVVLLGLTAGEYLYPKGLRVFSFGHRPPMISQPVSWLGRHSLMIYLIHQPVILLILAFMFPGSIWFFP
ncbi:MAG: DUF1624 domain-containing protein [Methanomicrobiales archaeon]|nr:DUF1624 domain-containing protein [Methanomicrobiales archaeon]